MLDDMFDDLEDNSLFDRKAALAKAKSVKALIMDVDGVLTDGRLYLAENGVETKVFHTRDGHGLKLLQRHGIALGVISGRRSNAVVSRMSDLGITHVELGVSDKAPVFAQMLTTLGLKPEEVAYIGDDHIDIEPMRAAGLGVAVADAHDSAVRAADWQTTLEGGFGAVREVCDLILDAQGLSAE